MSTNNKPSGRRPFDYSRFDRIAASLSDGDDDNDTADIPATTMRTASPADLKRLPVLRTLLGDLTCASIVWSMTVWGPEFLLSAQPWGLHAWSAREPLAAGIAHLMPIKSGTPSRMTSPRTRLTLDVPTLPYLTLEPEKSTDSSSPPPLPPGPEDLATHTLTHGARTLAHAPTILLHTYSRAMLAPPGLRIFPAASELGEPALALEAYARESVAPVAQRIYWRVMAQSADTYAAAIRRPVDRTVWKGTVVPVAVAQEWVHKVVGADSLVADVKAIACMLQRIDEDQGAASASPETPRYPLSLPTGTANWAETGVPSLLDPSREIPTASDAALAFALAPVALLVTRPTAGGVTSKRVLPVPDLVSVPYPTRAKVLRTHPTLVSAIDTHLAADPLVVWAAAWLARFGDPARVAKAISASSSSMTRKQQPGQPRQTASAALAFCHLPPVHARAANPTWATYPLPLLRAVLVFALLAPLVVAGGVTGAGGVVGLLGVAVLTVAGWIAMAGALAAAARVPVHWEALFAIATAWSGAMPRFLRPRSASSPLNQEKEEEEEVHDHAGGGKPISRNDSKEKVAEV
ncbi:hypothetical protein BC828DRAFT_415403 [Blastocladiella britannica]|nr:hypothetical protein BC828DRAFT_415403 [Blastocladiella britannica]